MNIPFVDLKTQYASIRAEIDGAVADVIGDAAFIGGKYVKAFEESFADFCGAKRCVGVGNGTDALYIALRSLGVGNGDEVITAANTFVATSEAITMTGAMPVFVDCERSTYNIDVKAIEGKITSKTKAIVPVHLYGQPADMDVVMSIAHKNGLSVVEDCAQAHGAVYKGRTVGTIGDIACFSFFPGKNLGAYGDAGAIVTNNEDLAEKARMIANHGRLTKFDHEIEGVNSRMDGLQAAILSAKLKYLDSWNDRRIDIAGKYSSTLPEEVVTPTHPPEDRHVYHLYVVRVTKREAIRGLLAKQGISTGIHYPKPLPFLKAYAHLGHKAEDFPVSHSFKDQILSLPIHGSMSNEEVEFVIGALAEIFTNV